MTSLPKTTDSLRQKTEALLESLGIARIIVVDDEYYDEDFELPDLLGVLAETPRAQRAGFPHMDGIDFNTPREIWADAVRARWERLDEASRQELRVYVDALPLRCADVEDVSDDSESALSTPTPAEEEHEPPSVAPDPAAVGASGTDTEAAESLEELLSGLKKCDFLTLSFTDWKERKPDLLTSEQATRTVYLFDRDLSREPGGTPNEGLQVVREVQDQGALYCGLITHTVSSQDEQEAARELARDYDLHPSRFLVIAKQRLTGGPPDPYSFLRVLRLVALNPRLTAVRSAVWPVLEASVRSAKCQLNGLSVLDFDQIVFASSRREGVWEPATLFRVFDLLVRRTAQSDLHQDEEIRAAVAEARRLSEVSEEIALALGEEEPSDQALRVQRFEMYESEESLNTCYLPIDLGDVFLRPSTGKHFMLLAQPCDLMVRRNGRRNFDTRTYGRTGALVEVQLSPPVDEDKDRWEEVPFYDQETRESAYLDLNKVHQVQLAVLDLCALQADGASSIDAEACCPRLLIDSWKKRYVLLQKFFSAALTRYDELRKRAPKDLAVLALPRASTTLSLERPSNGSMTIEFDLKRIMRLRQPWSGALLTAFARHQARAAFEHELDHRRPSSWYSRDR